MIPRARSKLISLQSALEMELNFESVQFMSRVENVSLRSLDNQEWKHSKAKHEFQDKFGVDKVASVTLEYLGIDCPEEVDGEHGLDEGYEDKDLGRVSSNRGEDDSRVL